MKPYLCIAGCCILLWLALPVLAYNIRRCDKIKSEFWVIFNITLSVAIFFGQIFLSVYLGAPYMGEDGDAPERHSPLCDTRINGLWLPGKHCNCGYRSHRYVQNFKPDVK